MIRKILTRYLGSWWIPTLVYFCLASSFTLTALVKGSVPMFIANVLFCSLVPAFLGILMAVLFNFIKRHWKRGIINLVFLIGCSLFTLLIFGFLTMLAMSGPSDDGFADHLTIPAGLDIAVPSQDESNSEGVNTLNAKDEFQDSIRKALAVAGGDNPDFTPNMPSLRKASTEQSKAFRDYIEASPNWHIFMENGNHFASRIWSYEGIPRDTLHGYISDFSKPAFQTRCLLCLDRKQWSNYKVQHAKEGLNTVTPRMTRENNLYDSQVMIECGGVWVEIFEQSDKPERRITKATLTALEAEFSEFEKNPQTSIALMRGKSDVLAKRLAGKDSHLFRLLPGMQPGIYTVVYALNPGEPGALYLKAFEITQGTPLSVDTLKRTSETRMTWSTNATDRFGAQAGFTIYEGDWGKPYAARFEVWFKPDSGQPDRKLAERNFKIEGWQR